MEIDVQQKDVEPVSNALKEKPRKEKKRTKKGKTPKESNESTSVEQGGDEKRESAVKILIEGEDWLQDSEGKTVSNFSSNVPTKKQKETDQGNKKSSKKPLDGLQVNQDLANDASISDFSEEEIPKKKKRSSSSVNVQASDQHDNNLAKGELAAFQPSKNKKQNGELSVTFSEKDEQITSQVKRKRSNSQKSDRKESIELSVMSKEKPKSSSKNDGALESETEEEDQEVGSRRPKEVSKNRRSRSRSTKRRSVNSTSSSNINDVSNSNEVETEKLKDPPTDSEAATSGSEENLSPPPPAVVTEPMLEGRLTRMFSNMIPWSGGIDEYEETDQFIDTLCFCFRNNPDIDKPPPKIPGVHIELIRGRKSRSRGDIQSWTMSILLLVLFIAKPFVIGLNMSHMLSNSYQGGLLVLNSALLGFFFLSFFFYVSFFYSVWLRRLRFVFYTSSLFLVNIAIEFILETTKLGMFMVGSNMYIFLAFLVEMFQFAVAFLGFKIWYDIRESRQEQTAIRVTREVINVDEKNVFETPLSGRSGALQDSTPKVEIDILEEVR